MIQRIEMRKVDMMPKLQQNESKNPLMIARISEEQSFDLFVIDMMLTVNMYLTVMYMMFVTARKSKRRICMQH